MHRTLRVLVPAMIALVLLLGAALPVHADLPLRSKSCGALITSSFRLKNDLTCTGHGLRIGAGGITIDLNGKTITGDGGSGDFGIYNKNGWDHVTIKTGTGKSRSRIEDFYNGIQSDKGGNYMEIRRVFVGYATHDGIKLVGNHHTLVSVKVLDAANEGIEIIGNKAVIRDGQSMRIADSTGDIAIMIEGDSNKVINMATLHGEEGIKVIGDYNVIKQNEVKEHSVAGIHIESGQYNWVHHNLICGGPDLTLDTGENNTWEDNATPDDCPA